MMLTRNENNVLGAVAKGMDSPGCGWLHELEHDIKVHGRSLSAVIGSLIKKDLVSTTLQDERDTGLNGPFLYIELTEKGEEYAFGRLHGGRSALQLFSALQDVMDLLDPEHGPKTKKHIDLVVKVVEPIVLHDQRRAAHERELDKAMKKPQLPPQHFNDSDEAGG